MQTTIALMTLMGLLPLTAMGQWEKYPTLHVPRTRDGRPNLNAPAPRMTNGKPDFSGVWSNPPCTGECPPGTKDEFLPLPAQFMDIGWGLKDGLPYQPWAAELVKTRIADFGRGNPDAHCRPIGIVQLDTHPYPRRIMQTTELVAILNEKDGIFRQIFTDGRSLPVDPQPWWYGYSVGKWAGDTLVVETRYFPENGWLDFRGAVYTGAAKITERFRRPDYGHLELEIMVDDSKAYTKPWTVTVNQIIQLDTDLFEFFCQENEKDVQHFK